MASRNKSKAQIDPKLSKALKLAGDEGTVEAVLMFDKRKNTSAAQQSDQLKQEIQDASNGEPMEANYFPSLGSVAVRTKSRVVKKLLKHPGLAVAALNRE